MLFRKFPLPYFAPSGSSADAGDELDTDGVDNDVEAGLADDGNAGVDVVDDAVDDEPVAEEPPAKTFADYGLPEDLEVLSQQYNQYRQQAARAQQLEALYWQQQAAAQAAAQKPAEPPAKPKIPWGEAPEFKREWLDLVHTDENGNLVAKPGAMPDLPQKIKQFAQWREQAQEKFFSDPMGALQDNFVPLIEQKAQEIAQRLFAQHEQQRALREYDQQNREIYYNADGSLNHLGLHFNQVYAQAVQAGFGDPIKVAHDACDAALFRAQLQAEANKPPSQEKQKADFLKKAANGANRIANRTGGTAKNGKKAVSVGGKDPWSKLRSELNALPEEDFNKDD